MKVATRREQCAVVTALIVCAQMPFVVVRSYGPDSILDPDDDTGGRVRLARGVSGTMASWVEIQDLRNIAKGTRNIQLPTGGSLDFSSTSPGQRSIAMVLNMLEDQGYSLLHATPGPARSDPEGPGGYIEYVMHTRKPIDPDTLAETDEDEGYSD